MKDYFVGPKNDKWQAKQPGADKASGVFDTQRQAEQQAKAWSANAGGGEVTIQGRDGQIRARDTVAPKPDNFPPRG
ncbi:MAG TPA: DUF2188 domain-containing protein [Candidatus Saccharimonadales bacterium]|jgi:hypothetical protein|nr:DUF2188 domain-containing protein [Candidatus Saccharimonadales bacterium]